MIQNFGPLDAKVRAHGDYLYSKCVVYICYTEGVWRLDQ